MSYIIAWIAIALVTNAVFQYYRTVGATSSQSEGQLPEGQLHLFYMK
jgi:hypothetical protein